MARRLACWPSVLSSHLSPRQPAQAQLEQLPSVADLAERLLPSVVEISVQTKSDTGGPALQMPDLPDNSPFKDFFDEFLKKQRKGQSPEPQDRSVNSMGSGFVIDASGLIVTNNHVVEGAEVIEVHFQDTTILKAELVGRDPKTDLAVLRVKPEKPLPVVAFGDSDVLRIGEWVMAIGNPFGLGGSVSLGIVSARNRDINAGPYDDFIQTDAAINKGNSGGPLFNLEGRSGWHQHGDLFAHRRLRRHRLFGAGQHGQGRCRSAGEVRRNPARLVWRQDPVGDR